MSTSQRALPFRVLIITDEEAAHAQHRGVVEAIARAVLPDAHDVAVLVRAKHRTIEHVRALCAALRPVTSRAGARLLVHTHLSLVNELALDGAHVDAHTNVADARRVLPTGALLGASRHAGEPLDDAAVAPLDYVTLSPIFAPSSKPNDARATLGLDGLRDAVSTSARPIVALGGIDDTRIAACMRAGASAVAVIGTVISAHDPRRALLALLDAAG